MTIRAAGCAAILIVCVTSCQSDGGSVVEKVKYDFGIGEKPEGYESMSDKIMARLEAVGKTEMRRMNVEGRHGTTEFQQESNLQGSYYKQVKSYESYAALEAVPVSRGSQGERGYVGYIQFTYRMMQGERTSNRTQAEAESAGIRTDITGRETYRYTFGPGGTWDGAPGELTTR